MKKGSDSILRKNRRLHHQHRRFEVKLELIVTLAATKRHREEASLQKGHSQQGKQATLRGEKELFLSMINL